MSDKSYIIEISEKYGITVDEDQAEKLVLLLEMLESENKKVNLTAINSFEDMAVKHILDSIILMKYHNIGGSRVIDIGSGAGFPVLPLAIMNKEASFVSIDSVNKKVEFQKKAINELGLTNVDAIHIRAEDLAKDTDYRGSFDLCTMRAVSSLPVILEYAVPFLKVGGSLVAYKGEDVEKEIEISENALQKLSSEIERTEKFILEKAARSLVFIKKVYITNDKYPRKAGVITKRPL